MTFSAASPPEKRLPVANAARGDCALLPAGNGVSGLAHHHSGASLKKSRPDKAMVRPASVSYSQSVKPDTADRGYDAGKKVRIKRHLAVDTPGLPHAIHITTANVTDRAGALAMFDRCRDGLSRDQCRTCWWNGGYTGRQPLCHCCDKASLRSRGGSGETQRTAHLRGASKTMGGGDRSFAWLEKCRRLWKNCERKLNTSLQMVVLAFMVLQPIPIW